MIISGLVGYLVFHDAVGKVDELAHDGNERLFWFGTASDAFLVKPFHHRVMSDCGDGWHVQL